MKPFKYLLLSLTAILLLAECSDESSVVTEPIEDTYIFPAPHEIDNIPHHTFKMGALFSYQGELRSGKIQQSDGTATEIYYNKPLFNANASTYTPDNEREWWDDLVEEIEYSGMDYVAANTRGRLPKADTDPKYERDHGDPTRIKDFLKALKRRGITDTKVAIFDDTPASWASARNFNLYGAYVYRISEATQKNLNLTDEQVLYPLDDLDEIYPYIWNYNIKLAFDNFYANNGEYKDYLFRFRGKPVLYLWNVGGFLSCNYVALGNKPIDCTGKLRAVLAKVQEDFKSTFGEELFICADKSFVKLDETLRNTPEILQSINGWFVAEGNNPTSFTVEELNGNKVGACVPAFSTGEINASRPMFLDPYHGKRFKDNFNKIIARKTDLVIIEGLTDMLEDAALWRSTDTKYFDFPNQRLNILRKYNSTRAYPETLRVECEACDDYLDLSEGNTGRSYRTGNLDVYKVAGSETTPTLWYVGNTEAGEYLEWKELPYDKGIVKISLRYNARYAASVTLEFGEGDDILRSEVIKLPDTNGEWKTEEIFVEHSGEKGWRRTILEITSGTPKLDYLIITNKKKTNI